jgi:hypothetical protein
LGDRLEAILLIFMKLMNVAWMVAGQGWSTWLKILKTALMGEVRENGQ